MNVLGTSAPVGDSFEVTTNNAGSRSVTVVPGGGGGGVEVPLSNVMFADPATTVALADQNGAIATPFALFASAMAAVPAQGSVYCTPQAFVPEGAITLSKDVQIVGMTPNGGNGCTFQSFATGAHTLKLQNCTVLSTVTGTGPIQLSNCNLNATTTGGAVSVNACVHVGDIVAQTLNLRDSTLVGSMTISSGSAQFTNTAFFSSPVLTFTGSRGTAQFDETSFANFRAAGGSIVNGDISSTNADVPVFDLITPQTLAASGAGAYVTLTAEGGGTMQIDASGLTAKQKLEVGVDASVANTGAGGGSITELRVNQTYIINDGLVLLEQSVMFAPGVDTVGGNPLIRTNISGTNVQIQGYQEPAAGQSHDYTVKGIYVQLVTVST